MRNGIKAVVLIAISPDNICWFIELKDYRRDRAHPISDLHNEIADKVFDSLAAMLPASFL